MKKLKLHAICTLGWIAWYALPMQFFMAFYSTHHPFLDWAVSTLIPDHKFLYYSLLYSSDIVLFFLLTLPFSIAMQYWLPPKPWTYIATAVFVVFLWEYQAVWSDSETLRLFLSSPTAYAGFAITLGLLPIAYIVSGRLIARYAA